MLSAMRISCLASLLAATVFSVPATGEAGTADVYILAGQSNMSGRGALDELSEAEGMSDPAIRIYGNDGQERVATEPLDDASDQVDAVSVDRMAAVGPGLFFARAMRSRDGRPILLVPCAKGGSSVGRWQPAEARDTLYGSCLARVRDAGGRLAGVLWYQGETDAERPAPAASRWRQAFAALVARARADADNPDLPVAFVVISDKPDRAEYGDRFASWSLVQAQQRGVDLPCTASVPAAGLPRNADDLHLSTAGQRVLGGLLADAMTDLHRRGCE